MGSYKDYCVKTVFFNFSKELGKHWCFTRHLKLVTGIKLYNRKNSD